MICNQIIWNNRNIKVDKKPVFYKHFVYKRNVYLNDLDFEKNSINSFEGKDLSSKYILHWLGIRAAVPSELKNSIMKVAATSLKFKSNKGTFDPYEGKCNNYYEILIEEKATKSRRFKKIQTKYKLEDKHVEEYFILPKLLGCETYLRSLQFKIRSDICYTKSKLFKIGYSNEDSCSFCGNATETMTHLFYECKKTKVFWNEVKMFWEGLENVLLNLTEKDIILGLLRGTSQSDHENLLNTWTV